MQSLPHYRYINSIPPVPLIEVQGDDDAVPIWCKLEYLNPSGSTKDRIARHILEKAWRRGEVSHGSLIVEASSGSTSIALALCCAQMGMKFVAFIPASATSERVAMIRAYGGDVRRIEGEMGKVINAARQFAESEDAFLTRQFENPDNAEAHELLTASEILNQLDDVAIDAVVSGIGTGGTLVGLHRGFTKAGCDTLPVAAIPCHTGGGFATNIECCSLTFSKDVPGVVDGCSRLYSDWKQTDAAKNLRELVVDEDECLRCTRELWSLGFPVGPSSGLNLAAARAIGRESSPDATIVTVFPDRMERYFSHKVFAGIAE
ncbi:MAG TPA: cysteine synthase family protein [Xanthomonadales bacterium]|nr:cysteine synthase family protein [Xanthomonadales bacterium]